MLSSLRKRYRRRTRSVNECDLEHSDGHKSRFSMFSQKSNCQHQVTTAYSTQSVHSEPTRRKFGSGLQLNRSKSNSIKKKMSYGAISRTDSNRSLGTDSNRSFENLDLVSSGNHVSGEESVSQYQSISASPPGSPRRLAICAELEKDTFMENGESLLIGHKNLVIRDFLETYAYI